MPSYDVPAEFIADFKGSLKIDAGSFPPASDGRNAKGFCSSIHGKPRAAVFLTLTNHGETDAWARDRRALQERLARILAKNRDAMQIGRARLDGAHLAYIGDDSREHGYVRTKCSIVSRPSFSLSRRLNRSVIVSIGVACSGGNPFAPMLLSPRSR